MPVLEGELVTNGQLDNAVLHLTTLTLVDLRQTDVVAAVNHDRNRGNLIRYTNGDRDVELLTLILNALIEILSKGGVFIIYN